MIKLERVYDAVRCAGPTSALRSSDLADGDVPTPAGHRTSDDPLEAVIAQLLTTLGIELDNQHFRRTPVRVAKFYREFTRGYVARPADILKTFRSANRDLIVVSNIDFYSLCPHHLLIYGGRMHFGYVPDGLIAGVSKIPRLVHALAARMVVQEDLVADIADAFMEVVRPLGCAVKATARHDCVAARGVRCREGSMTTIARRGLFQDQSSFVDEFHQVIAQGVPGGAA